MTATAIVCGVAGAAPSMAKSRREGDGFPADAYTLCGQQRGDLRRKFGGATEFMQGTSAGEIVVTGIVPLTYDQAARYDATENNGLN